MGIPLIYLGMLYSARHALRHREDLDMIDAAAVAALGTSKTAKAMRHDRDSGIANPAAVATAAETRVTNNAHQKPDVPSALGFLWEAYQPRFWWWEVADKNSGSWPSAPCQNRESAPNHRS